MQFFTSIDIARPTYPIHHSDRILLMGSCFADSMVSGLQNAGFRVSSNPFGTLYNPFSISTCVRRIVSAEPFSSEDLVEYGGMFHSMLHHGMFSSADKQQCLEDINASVLNGYRQLMEADVCIFTFGTAYVYKYEGKVVANCHKLPDSLFERRLISTDEIVKEWTALLSLPIFENKRIIFSVSPIRHIRDGMHANQVSKATLLLAIEQLLHSPNLATDHLSYFPAYEIVLDELRDYRFYSEDMVHPSDQAVRHIQDRFFSSFLAQDAIEAANECSSFFRDRAHRLLHPESDASRRFLEALRRKETALLERYPYLDLSINTDN